MARLAKRAGLSVVYYISPQIWAWRPGRVKRVARYVDKMLTLFPFEVPFYTAAGVDAEYVGHPLLDHLHELPTPAQAAHTLGLDAQAPAGGAFTWESPAGTAESPPHHACRLPAHPTASAARARDYPGGADSGYGRSATVPGTLSSASDGYALDKVMLALRAAHFALVASGTATLEAGLIGTPMVVVYKMHPITAWLARRVLCIPYIGLVNIVAGRPVVPELLQEALCPQTLAALALHCLEQPEVARHVRQELAILRQTLGTGEGARRAAACVGQFLQAAEARAAATVQG